MPLALFDLDNTLADRDAAFRRWAQRFVADHGLDVAAADWLVHADGGGLVPRPQYLSSVREKFGHSNSVDDLVEEYARTYPESYVREDASVDALRALRSSGSWRFAIVSNGP